MLICQSQFISNGPSCPIFTALIRGVMAYNFVVLFCITDIEFSSEEIEADTGSGGFGRVVNK